MTETSVPSGVKFYSWTPGVGYGDIAKAYMIGLANAGVPVSWIPMVSSVAWTKYGLWSAPYEGVEWIKDPELTPFCNRDIPYDTVIIPMVPEFFPHIVDLEPGKNIVGCTIWETDRIPELWPPLLNSCDQIVVPTEWNRQVFSSCGVVKPIHVVPYILPESARPSNPSTLRGEIDIHPNDFVFYTINTWSTRKATDATIGAYLKAFSAEDHTVLVIKTTKRDYDRWQPRLDLLQKLLACGLEVLGLTCLSLRMVAMVELFRATSQKALQQLLVDNKNHPKIILITDEWPRDEIEALHRRGDCFVSLCHAEGWGLGAFEAAGHGNRVVITGFGGQTEFLPNDLADLVDYDLVSVQSPNDAPSFTSDQHWGCARIEHAVELLQEVFENRGGWQEKGEKLQQHIHKYFNQEVVTKRLIEVLLRRGL